MTSMPITFAGVDSGIGRTTMVGQPVSTVDSSYLFKLFGEPDGTYQNVPRHIQNVTMETIYQLYSNRQVKFLSLQMTEMIALRNGSWILSLLAPIKVSVEQNFSMFRNMVNIVPHQPVPPGGIPRMFTTTRQTWMISKVSNALMAGIDVRVLLDPNMGPTALGDILYGLSVSVVFTLQQQTVIEAVRKSHDRGLRSARGNAKAYLDPQRQLTWEAQYFAIAAKDPSQFLFQINQFARTVAMKPNMIILWQGGRALLQAHNMKDSVNLTAWVRSQDPLTNQLFEQQLPIVNGEQIIQDTNGIAYVEVPDLRLKESDPEFNVLQTNCTIAQYYYEPASAHTRDSTKIGRCDVGIYDLPADNMVRLRVENALNYCGVYADVDMDTNFGESYDDIDKRYTKELNDFIKTKNARPNQPRGHNNADRKILDGLSRRGDAGSFDFDSPTQSRTVEKVRDQFIFATWDPEDAQFFIPPYVGSIERRFLPQGWVDYQCSDIMQRLDELCAKSPQALSVLTELKEFVMQLDNRDYTEEWFTAVLKQNYGRYYKYLPDKETTVIVAEMTPKKRIDIHGGSALAEFVPNEYGGLDLPTDFEGVPVNSILAGYANGPGLRTIAREATKVTSRYGAVGTKVNAMLRSFDTLISIISAVFRDSDFINPALASPWFHKDDVLTVVIENLFASRPPAFFHVPPPLGESASNVNENIFDADQRPGSLIRGRYPSIKFNLDNINKFYAGENFDGSKGGDASVKTLKLDGLGLSPTLAATNTISLIHRIVATLGPAAANVYKDLINNTDDDDKKLRNLVLKTVVAAEQYDFVKLINATGPVKEYLNSRDVLTRNRLVQFAIFQYLSKVPKSAEAVLAIVQQKQSSPRNIETFSKNISENIMNNAADTSPRFSFYKTGPVTLVQSIEMAPLATINAQRLVILKSLHGKETASDIATETQIKAADAVETAYRQAYDSLSDLLSKSVNGYEILDDDARANAITSLLAGNTDEIVTGPGGDDKPALKGTEIEDVGKILAKYDEAIVASGFSKKDIDEGGNVTINRPRTTSTTANTVTPDLTANGFARGNYVRSPLTVSGKLASEIFATLSGPESRPIILPGDKEHWYDQPLTKEPKETFQKAPEFAALSAISTHINTDLQSIPLARAIAGANRYMENISAPASRMMSTQSRPSRGGFDFDIEGLSSSTTSSFRPTSAPRGYGDWLSPGNERQKTAFSTTDPSSANVFQRPMATKALRGPWKDRLHDLNNSPSKNTLHEFLRFVLLFTPNKLASMQAFAIHGVTLPFDVMFWRLGMSFRMNNILLAKAGAMTLQLSPAHIRTVTDNMRGEVFFQSWIDYAPMVMDEQALVFVPNVSPAGYNGGANSAYITSPATDIGRDHISQPSVIATLHPLTEALDNSILHFSNTSVFEGITNAYSSQMTQYLWSGAEYYSRYYSEYVKWANSDDKIRNAISFIQNKNSDQYRTEHVKGLYLESQVSLLAFPGPHIGMRSDGQFTKLANGLGPAGELVANWPGAKRIWMGTPGQFPTPNISTVMGFL